MTFEQLKDLACKHFKVTNEQIENCSQKTNAVYAKVSIAMVLHMKGYSVGQIADMLHLHHYTVFRHLKTFDDRMKYDVIFRNTYKQFKEECD